MRKVTEDAVGDKVAASFGAAAEGYETLAKIQRECAVDLLSLLDSPKPELPDGPVLEIGCGTGFVTRGLVRSMNGRPIRITDISSEMIAYCGQNLPRDIVNAENVSFGTLDAHTLRECRESYALIAGGFVLQWLRDPIIALQDLYDALMPGGCLLLSFPTSRSFPEWRRLCAELGLPFTANPLPEPDIMQKVFRGSGIACITRERVIREAFPRPSSFFHSLKAIGAEINVSGLRLSVSQMRRLLRAWEQRSPGGITGSYHVVFGLLRRC